MKFFDFSIKKKKIRSRIIRLFRQINVDERDYDHELEIHAQMEPLFEELGFDDFVFRHEPGFSVMKSFALSKLKRLQEAQELVEEKLIKFPDHPGLTLELGLVFLNREEFEKAIEVFDKSIELNSNDAEAFYYRAISYSYLNDLEKCMEDLEKSLELDPESPETWRDLVLTHNKKENYSEGERIGREAIEKFPEDGGIYNLVGNSLLELDKRDEACEFYQKAVELGTEMAQKNIDEYCKP